MASMPATEELVQAGLDPAKDRGGIEEGDHEAAPQRRAHEAEPGEEDEGAPQQRDEQPVATGCIEAEDAVPRSAARRIVLPDRHPDEAEKNEGEERSRRPGPGHPVEQ